MIKKKTSIKNKTNRKKSGALLALCVIAIMAFAYLGYFGLKTENYTFKPFTKAVKRGLDLQGGISVVEEIQAKKVTLEDMSREIEFLTMRVNKLGVSEIEVKQEGEKRIRIEIPGVFDAKGVMDTVGKTGELKFIGPDKKVILTGKDVKNAMAVISQQNNKPEISLELNEEGRKKFAVATKKFLNQPISIYMDDQRLTIATVNDVISTGNASISGSKSMEEAKTQADMIKSGALPLPIKPVSYKTVGATLGSTVLPNTKLAAIIGIVLVLIFMAVLYRIPGIIADIALVLFILLDLTAFIMIDATLTLAGIAGFLLTIGMAVDANVLIFERTKEELKAGKSIKSAVDAGFHRALSSILDSNITTIISAIVLYFMGTGAVRGFAVTLMLGILLSMFTALTVTKFILKLSLESGILSKASHFGVKKKDSRTLKIVEKTKIWFGLSVGITILGILFILFRGLNYGIDFTGGTLMNVDMGRKVTVEDKKKIEDTIKPYTTKYSIRDINEKKEYEIIIQNGAVSENKIAEISKSIGEKLKIKNRISEETIGGTVGKELTKKAWMAVIIASIAMLIYISIRFEFYFGTAAIIALLHDVFITLSVYAIFGVRMNSPFIAAILTILGYSINDTIVIFDRIRENQKRLGKVGYTELVDVSVTETMARSINTTLSTLITIVALLIMVPSIREFTFPLTIGVASGAYSSIFIASPIWVLLKKKKQKTKITA